MIRGRPRKGNRTGVSLYFSLDLLQDVKATSARLGTTMSSYLEGLYTKYRTLEGNGALLPASVSFNKDTGFYECSNCDEITIQTYPEAKEHVCFGTMPQESTILERAMKSNKPKKSFIEECREEARKMM